MDKNQGMTVIAYDPLGLQDNFKHYQGVVWSLRRPMFGKCINHVVSHVSTKKGYARIHYALRTLDQTK